ncbi:MAG: indole-3-glycerol phosphate synthase TrpC [Acidobacteriota bacterium]|nr:indole-3-glycerol phosphate synthase TrpC [Acidobacteriota bacterium]
MTSGTYLAEIVAAHRAMAAADRRDTEALAAAAASAGPARGFAGALAGTAAAGLAVVAEVKRRSPSRGDLDPGLDPAAVATDYAAGGARCLSVLTDERFFGGAPADLAAARAACSLPVLRKDFTVCPADVYDTRAMGADAVLLIVAALDDAELAALHALAGDLGLDALVEVHDEEELARALEAGATLVGVNQRDLVTFEVDHARAERLAPAIPTGVVAVAESGVRDAPDAARLAAAGYQAILVGETLVRSADRAGAVAALAGHRVGDRRAQSPASSAPGRATAC